MTFVIYHISSTMQMGPTPHGNPHSLYSKYYKTRHAAIRTMTKWNDRALELDAKERAERGDDCWGMERTAGVGPGPYGVAELGHYRDRVVRKVTRVNMMSGLEYQENSNTHGFCSPSSEAYWSM